MIKKARIFKIAGVMLLVTALFMASLFAAAIYFTPQLVNYKSEIIQGMETALGFPVSIEKMDAKWSGLHPIIDLQGITVWNKPHSVLPLLKIKDLQVRLSVWDFLWKQKIMTDHIKMDQVEVQLTQQKNGSFAWVPAGMSANTAESSHQTEKILDYLLQQNFIQWSDITLDLRFLEGHDLQIKNLGGQMWQSWGDVYIQMKGALLEPHHEPPVRGIVAVEAELEADHVRLQDLSGLINLTAEQLDIPTWSRFFPPAWIQVQSGKGRLALKSTWSNGQPELLNTSMALDHLTLQVPELGKDFGETLQWTDAAISGDLQWERQAQGWKLIGKHVALSKNGVDVPPTNFHIAHSDIKDFQTMTWQERLRAGNYLIQFDQVDLAIVEEVMQTSPLLQKKLPAWWPVGFTGKLQNVSAQIDDITSEKPIVDLSAHFQEIGLAYQENLNIGFQGLTGTIDIKPTTGQLQIDSTQLQLQAPKLFTVGIELPKLSSKLHWEKTDQGWLATGNGRSEILNQGLFNISGKFLLSPQIENSYVSMSAEGSNIPVVPAMAMYTPRLVMPAGTVKWLDLALQQGTIEKMTVELEGHLKDFPFANDQGKFEVNLHAKDAVLKFHPDWPALTQLDGQLIFRGDAFYANILKAQMGGETIEKAVVTIPEISLKGIDLNVVGQIDGLAENIVTFLQETPLWEVLKARLSPFSLSGPASIDLSLDLPIFKPHKTYQVSGAVDFHHAAVQMTMGDLLFTDVIGQLHFNEKGSYADNLTGQLYGQPVAVQLATKTPEAEPKYLMMHMQGQLDMQGLKNHYPSAIWNDWSGITPFTVDLEWHDLTDKKQSVLAIKSPLSGLLVALPEPLAKTAAQSRPLAVTVLFGDHQQNIKVQYDNILTADLFANMPKDKINLLKGTLAIDSKTKIPMPTNGLQMMVNMPNVDIRGNVNIPVDQKNPIRVHLSYLALKPESSEKEKKDISFPSQNLPDFDVRIDRLLLNDQVLGELTLNTQMQKNVLEIRSIKLINPGYSFSAAARWKKEDVKTTSYLQGTFTTKNLGQMLKNLQLNDSMTNGTGKTTLDLLWTGSPYAWDLNTLEGTMQIDWTKGHLAKVKPGIGRILSLFNVNGLARRLRLDFNDVLKKGFTFDKITSDLNFSQGVISTNDGKVKSTSGEIDFNGNAYATNKTLDMYLTVKPALPGLPVAATVASLANPLVGAVTFAVNKAVPKITGGLALHYHVTGPWDDPQIQKGKE